MNEFSKRFEKTVAKLNERFYLTNEFTERSFSEKMKEIVAEYYPSSNFYKGVTVKCAHPTPFSRTPITSSFKVTESAFLSDFPMTDLP